MAAGGAARHLELHVRTAAGAVVTNAQVMLSVVDDTAHAAPVTVPIATMQGIKAGVQDFHYGNNVEMIAGHSYTVTASVDQTQAQFQFVLAP